MVPIGEQTMNIVHTRVTSRQQLKAQDLIGRNMLSHKHTAFVGQCGIGPEHSLYLITYEAVVLANDPHDTWNDSADIVVDRYCDVTINEY